MGITSMDVTDSFLSNLAQTGPQPALPAGSSNLTPQAGAIEAAGGTPPAAPVVVMTGPGIHLKLLIAFGMVVGAIALFVLVAVGRLFGTIEHAARLEATHVAQGIAETASEIGLYDTLRLQEYVQRLTRVAKRDTVIVDLRKRGVADADPAELGRVFEHDPDNEVSQTLLDGYTRAFIERNEQHPEGARQIVVPVRSAVRGEPVVSGAVILEYTHIRDELVAGARGELILIIGAGLTLIVFISLLGAGISRQVTRPLRRLQSAVRRVQRHDYAARVPVDSTDELGMLGTSFNQMASALRLKQADLQAHRAMLEQRVADATAELRVANQALQAEIHEREKSARRNEYLAHHDSLTALPNRTEFTRLLNAALRQARAFNRQFGLLFIDLDRFKNINDTLGHATGDEFLQQIALRLRAAIGDAGRIARFGGDEFAVLLDAISCPEEIEMVAQKILEAAAKPYRVQGKELHVTASIGCATFPRDGIDERALLKHADIAMYQAKDEGKNNFQFYSARLNSHSLERLALESDLRAALDRGQLEVHYQPKIDAASGRIGGMEALLRWEHPEWGMIPPSKFIPIAEETGLILPIGKWALHTACRQTVEWIAAGARPLCIAVNLSARQFADEELLADVVAALKQTGLPPQLLELEITESLVMRDVAKAQKVLAALKRMGVRLAIDDFGTGYSSLSNLKKFPLDTIKIDRSFVRDLPGCPQDSSITRAIISMSHALGLSVVAEGVETEAQAAFLRRHDCGEFQGFLFSKPLDAAGFGKLLERDCNALVPLAA